MRDRKQDLIYNERIKAKRVRLVDDEKLIGEMSLNEALIKARQSGLDLVIISDGDIPVCRILEVGHFKYEKKKAEREQARKQREMAVETKEIQLRPVTDENDLNIKAKKAKEFLEEGDKARVVVKFRGRERQHKELGQTILEKFLSLIGEYKIDKPLVQNNESISIVVASLLTKAEIKKVKTCQESTS